MQSNQQPWISSGTQRRPPLPPLRPPSGASSIQQRPNTGQLHLPSAYLSSPQPQNSPSSLQQFPQLRSITQTLAQQQQASSSQSPSFTSKTSHPAGLQPSATASGTPDRTANIETEESRGRIIKKRTISDLFKQISPSERLDPEVEDILVDIAEDFVDSITSFGCALAKHRKSDTLEAKDILLHLERNWNMTIPGFGGDDIKAYRKPAINEVHRERLSTVKKSMLSNDADVNNSKVQ